MNVREILLAKSTIIGTSDAVFGKVFRPGSMLVIPYLNLCLMNFPGSGDFSYLNRCVVCVEVDKYLGWDGNGDCSGFEPSDRNWMTLGGRSFEESPPWGEVDVLVRDLRLFADDSLVESRDNNFYSGDLCSALSNDDKEFLKGRGLVEEVSINIAKS